MLFTNAICNVYIHDANTLFKNKHDPVAFNAVANALKMHNVASTAPAFCHSVPIYT